MIRTLKVYLGEQEVGFTEIEQQGLYYKLRCRCRLAHEGLYRLMAQCGEKTEDMGICVPFSDGFGVDKKVPVKKLGTAELSLYLEPVQKNAESDFIPLREDAPFEAIAYLTDAKFAVKDGMPGVIIADIDRQQ